MTHPTRRPLRPARRRGFSLLEVVVSAMLVGVLLVAAMRTVGASIFAQNRVGEQSIGQWLADGLLSEVVARAYKEDAALSELGPDSGEVSKADFDDVDDFCNWSESPPQLAGGTPMPDLDGWTRTVGVAWADPANWGQTAVSDTGIKRITVRVTHRGRLVCTRMALRTDAP